LAHDQTEEQVSEKTNVIAPRPASAAAGLRVRLFQDLCPERERCEHELLERGVPLPAPHRTPWANTHPTARSWFFAVLDPRQQCCGGFAAEVNPSRALPGHLLLRVERFGSAMPHHVADAALNALLSLAYSNRRILRVNIEVFARDNATRAMLAKTLADHRLRPSLSPRNYANTIAVDLTPDQADIFASLRGSARRKIRAIAKHPLAVQPINDFALAHRMQQLYAETMSRTAGHCPTRDWTRLIHLAQHAPELCRIVGLFRTDAHTPSSLLAFACACFHRDYAHYHAAASTRRSDFHIPLGYALAWDLICWAKRQHATWFDFGGVTLAHDHPDPLAGISEFKRHFSHTLIPVGGEWILEPRPLRARLAHAISSSAAWLSRIRPH